MVRVGYTYLRTKFMVVVPTHGHDTDSAHHDCDHALMVAIPTELSHVTLAIYENRLVAMLIYL